MVIAISRRQVQSPSVEWRTATPLWSEYGGHDEEHFHQPALLRFATDAFMDDFIELIQRKAERMGEWYVRKETWRLPAPTPQLGGPKLPSAAYEEDEESLPEELHGIPLKLFQPAHERYYIVSASLVCRIPGLPDKILNPADEEQVSFVVRRLMRQHSTEDIGPANPVLEYALVDGMWAEIPDGQEDTLFHTNEEEYSLFPVSYNDEQRDNVPRRLFGGLLPISQREKLLNAGRAPLVDQTIDPESPEAQESKRSERIEDLMTVFDMEVLQPWREINRQCDKELRFLAATWNDAEDNRTQLRRSVERSRDRLQVSSWYVLLNFAYFLRDHLPDLWGQLYANPNGPIPNNLDGKVLWNELQWVTFTVQRNATTSNNLAIVQQKLLGKASANEFDDPVTFAEALKNIYDARGHLEQLIRDYVDPNTVPEPNETLPTPPPAGEPNWPSTRFLLCGQHVHSLVNVLDDRDAEPGLMREALNISDVSISRRIPLRPMAAQLAATIGDYDYADDEFVVRCVLKRPYCPPSRQIVVSEKTRQFQMASYFDPDAPTRPVRIPMPIDMSPAGLRKFAKNTMFVLSDTLACQVGAARDLSFGDLVLSVLPWPFHKDLPDTRPGDCQETGSLDLGMLCTLSIPIITVCALILLIIIVQLLDVIFKWVPYLIFCLPIPGLKPKGEAT